MIVNICSTNNAGAVGAVERDAVSVGTEKSLGISARISCAEIVRSGVSYAIRIKTTTSPLDRGRSNRDCISFASNKILSVEPGSVAYTSGILPGDKIA